MYDTSAEKPQINVIVFFKDCVGSSSSSLYPQHYIGIILLNVKVKMPYLFLVAPAIEFCSDSNLYLSISTTYRRSLLGDNELDFLRCKIYSQKIHGGRYKLVLQYLKILLE